MRLQLAFNQTSWINRSKTLGPSNVLTLRSMTRMACVNRKRSLLNLSEAVGVADNSLQALENVNAAYESLFPESEISAPSLDRLVLMYNLAKIYKFEGSDTKATALQNRVSQLKLALHAKNVIHEVLSKEVLNSLDGFEGDLIFDMRPERLLDVR